MPFFNIAFSIIIFYVTIIAIIKFLPVLGINPKNKIKVINHEDGYEVSKKGMLKVFFVALSLRIVLYIISLLSGIVMLLPTELTLDFFLDIWDRWDAPRYTTIAEYGYGEIMYDEPDNYNLVFFPLYPWLIRLVNLIIPNIRITGLLISTLCYSAAMAFMYALVASEYGKKVAKLSVVLISIAPFSFFLGGIMTESIFLLTTVWAWYLIKRRKWFAAAIVGAFSAMSRIVGVLIVIPYILELIEANSESFKEKKYKEFFKKCFIQGFWILIIPFGLLVYLALNYYYSGDCFKFFEYQNVYWNHSFCYFGQGLQKIWNEILGDYRTLLEKVIFFGPQALSFTFSALLMLICCRRHRCVYTLYYVAYFIIVTSDTWYMSGARFMMVVVPLYIMLAEKIKNNDVFSYGLISISTMLYGIYSTLYFAGYGIM